MKKIILILSSVYYLNWEFLKFHINNDKCQFIEINLISLKNSTFFNSCYRYFNFKTPWKKSRIITALSNILYSGENIKISIYS